MELKTLKRFFILISGCRLYANASFGLSEEEYES